MVVVVGPNTALDHVVFIRHLASGTVRTTNDYWTVGGGGANVARILRNLGVKVDLIGLVGGSVGQMVEDMVAREGGAMEGVTVSGSTRVDTAIVERATGRTTLLVSAGPPVKTSEWKALDHRVREALATRPDALVLTGSLPPHVPSEAYLTWVMAAREAGVQVAVDASGVPLRLALEGVPEVLKVTSNEFEEAFDIPPDDGGAGIPARAAELLRSGVREVVVTRGAEGAMAFTPEGSYVARALTIEHVLTTVGCGDAFMAGLLARYLQGATVPSQLRLATAAAALSLLRPGAELPENADPLRIEGDVVVERLDAGVLNGVEG